MSTAHEGPRCHGGQTHVQYARQGALYRLPPCLRILPKQAASAAKSLIVAGVAHGLIPARLAEALIRWGGLRHA